MYANKFAEGYAAAWVEESARRAARSPSPREPLAVSPCSSSPYTVYAAYSSAPCVPQHAACTDCGGDGAGCDPLASRISFFMDDGVASSNDEVSPALSRHSSSRGAPPAPLSPSALCPVHARRSRSFRLETHDAPRRPRLYRHGSDVGPCDHQPRRTPSRSKRERRVTPERGGSKRRHGATPERGGSKNGNGGGRRHAAAAGGGTPERGGSVRSHRSSGRRRASSASRASAFASATAAERRSSFLLPHADLPPKERRRRMVVLIVIFTFMFLVVCSVLTVLVTLTDSSFRKSPPDGVRYNMSDGAGGNVSVSGEDAFP